MSDLAQLLVPAIRWDRDHGYDRVMSDVDRALALGVGGFILFGGHVAEVTKLTGHLARSSRHPILIAADMERGAGQQFEGATGLPPLGAIASLADQTAIRLAARVTAREARALGVNWDYAPVCDLDLLPENPIVGTRSLGHDHTSVSHSAATWIEACQGNGVLACAKHFPGHGRTSTDSHAELPVVDADESELLATDLSPFRAAINAGVASIMTAHVAYPSLDPSRAPATLSKRILTALLRDRLGFDGLVVTDALIMEGVLVDGGEVKAGVAALSAGCDLLLYPTNLLGVVTALEAAVRSRALAIRNIDRSLARRQHWAEWAANASAPPADAGDLRKTAELAESVVRVVRGRTPSLGSRVELQIVDDDLGGAFPAPSRDPFLETLGAGGVEVVSPGSADNDPTRPPPAALLLLFGDIKAWKGRPGYSQEAKSNVSRAVARARDEGRELFIVQFSHPRLADEIADAPNVVSAWGGERVMQQAAARWLVARR